jgi:hypothetical protein
LQAQRHLAIASELSYGIEIRNSTPTSDFATTALGKLKTSNIKTAIIVEKFGRQDMNILMKPQH